MESKHTYFTIRSLNKVNTVQWGWPCRLWLILTFQQHLSNPHLLNENFSILQALILQQFNHKIEFRKLALLYWTLLSKVGCACANAHLQIQYLTLIYTIFFLISTFFVSRSILTVQNRILSESIAQNINRCHQKCKLKTKSKFRS